MRWAPGPHMTTSSISSCLASSLTLCPKGVIWSPLLVWGRLTTLQGSCGQRRPRAPSCPSGLSGLPHILDGDDCVLHGDRRGPQLHNDPGDVPSRPSP